MDLNGAVAVITGGASGIGRATADRLAAQGARPVTWDVSGGDIPCDVTSIESVEAAHAQTVANHGVPTILVAAAGVGRVGRIVDLNLADWDLTYAVNIRGVMLALRVVARGIIDAGLSGSCILVSSVNGTVADSAHSMYSTSKAAVNHLARCAAVEMGSQGIRVNAIAPGPVETPMMSGVFAIEGYRQKIADTTPLGRIAQPDDIAQAIVHVLESDWVTGQVIGVDGGSALMSARGHDRARGLAENSDQS